MALLESIAAGLGGAIGRDWSKSDAATQAQANERGAERAMDFSSAEALANRNWQEHMSNTSWQRGTADMMAAGINPMLAYMKGGATTPSGGQGTGSAAQGAATRNADAIPLQSMATAAQVENVRAQTKKVEAEEKEVIARTPTHAATIQKIGQDIAESIERIQRIQQEVRTGASTAAHLDQQVVNLKETIPQIHASIAQLKTLAALNEAEAITQLTQQGVNRAHAAEIIQRIKQDLPRLERELQVLERTARQMAQPGQMADEAAKDSFVGQVGAYLKALIPLQGLIGTIPLGRAMQAVPKYKPNPAYSNPPR